MQSQNVNEEKNKAHDQTKLVFQERYKIKIINALDSLILI